MEAINKIFQHIALFSKRFLPLWQLYGFSVAFYSFIFPFCHLFGNLKPYIAQHKHRAILMYLKKRYTAQLDRYTNCEEALPAIDPYSSIWVCWWDGEDDMAPLVKACYNSIIHNAGTHPVKFITKHNFREFVSIPEYILDKLNSGIMTLTHFSNILRVNLLHDHGGIWMDATILTLKNMSLENLQFFTLKAPARSASVTLNSFDGITSPQFHIRRETPISRWSGFLLAGTKHSPVFAYLRDILYAYWKNHDDQIDYLLFDYTIALGSDNIPIMKKLIDDVPCSDVEKFELEKSMNREYTEESFSKFTLTPFHKLTWKKKFVEYTKDGKLTIYGHILNTFGTLTA